MIEAENREFLSFSEIIQDGDVKDVEDYYKEKYVNNSDEDMIPFHHACVNNRVDFVEFILKNDLDVEVQNEDGMRAVHFATYCGHEEILRMLMDHNCDMEASNKNQERAIHFAVSGSFESILQILIDRNCDTEASNKNGERPIHLAAQNDNENILLMLINKGCDIEAMDNNGWRAIHHVALSANTALLHMLINYNCDIEAAENNGKRVVHIAAYHGHIDILKVLIDQKCNIEVADNNGRRAIHHATSNGQLHTLRFLLDLNVNIEAQNQIGRRAVHYATHIGHVNMVQMLIDENCDINARTKEKETPLYIAEKQHNEDCKMVIKKAIKERKEIKVIESVLMQGGPDAVANVLKRYPLTKMIIFETKTTLLDVLLNRNDDHILDLVKTKCITPEEISDFHEMIDKKMGPVTHQRILECFLYRSIRFEHSSLFYFLCEPTAVNREKLFGGPSVLETVVEYGKVLYVKLVLSRLLRVDETWILALDVAKKKGYDMIASLISSRMKYLNLQDEDGYDRLHIAIFDNDPEMVDYILENNHVKGNYQDNNVGSAVRLAYFLNYQTCVDRFEDRQMKVTKRDSVETF